MSFLLILLISRVLKDKKQEAMVRHEVHKVFQLFTNERCFFFSQQYTTKLINGKSCNYCLNYKLSFQAGEALGAIGSPEVLNVLREYASDPQIEVFVHFH